MDKKIDIGSLRKAIFERFTWEVIEKNVSAFGKRQVNVSDHGGEYLFSIFEDGTIHLPGMCLGECFKPGVSHMRMEELRKVVKDCFSIWDVENSNEIVRINKIFLGVKQPKQIDFKVNRDLIVVRGNK